jgi:hypothetical protein
MSEDDPGTLRDLEVALAFVDELRTILEVLVANGVISAEVIAGLLRRQREIYSPARPGAVFVIDYLLKPLTDLERAAARKGHRPPGST